MCQSAVFSPLVSGESFTRCGARERRAYPFGSHAADAAISRAPQSATPSLRFSEKHLAR